jgi:hypothetical protein
MADFGISYIIKFIYSILTILLLVFVYTYITNLEEKGCKCALSPNNAFIKGFTLFAIIYLIFTGFISDKMIKDNFGTNVHILYKIIDIIFIIVFIYYLYVVFQYTRFLVNEKCKCSVDIRREIIMIGSLIEFGLIFILFLLHIILFTVFSVFFNIVKEVGESSDSVRNVIRDPINSMRQVPSKVKSEMKNISSYVSKTGKEIRKIGTRTNSKK